MSGIDGVEWDAVELPSQFLENWCWEPEALADISGHYETGEPLPQNLLDNMLAARNFQSAMQMVRQLEFSLFDMKLHYEFDAAQGADIAGVLQRVREHVAVRIPPEYNRFQHSFGHIFAVDSTPRAPYRPSSRQHPRIGPSRAAASGAPALAGARRDVLVTVDD